MNNFLIHLATLALVIVGILSVKGIFGSFLITAAILTSITIGYATSWYRRHESSPYLSLLVNVLSICMVIWLLSGIFFGASFDLFYLIRIFIKILIGLQLFHSFILHSKRDYTLNQTISIPLIVFSALLFQEERTTYLIYLGIYLSLWIFILRSQALEESRKTSMVVVDTSTSRGGFRRELGIILGLFLILCLSSLAVFPYIPLMKEHKVGLLPSRYGRVFEMMGFVKRLLPWVDESAPYAKRGYVADEEKKPEPLKGTGPGPGVDVSEEKPGPDLAKEPEEESPLGKIEEEKEEKEKEEEEEEEQKDLKEEIEEIFKPDQAEEEKQISYKEEGTIDGREYQMTRFDMIYDTRGKLVSYSEMGTVEHEEYQMERTDITYDKEGNLTGYQERGIQDGQSYQFTYPSLGQEELLFHRGIPEEGQKQMGEVSGVIRDGEGKITSYQEKGLTGGEGYQMSRSGISYDDQGRVTGYSESGSFGQKRYQLVRSNVSYGIPALTPQDSKEPRREERGVRRPQPFSKAETEMGKEIVRSLWWYLVRAMFILALAILAYFLFISIRREIERRKLQALAFEDPRSFILRLYESISFILRFYGSGRPDWMAPEEHLATVTDRWSEVKDLKGLTEKFLEANFSTHQLAVDSSYMVLERYHNIISQLKNYGGIWKNFFAQIRKLNLRLPPEVA